MQGYVIEKAECLKQSEKAILVSAPDFDDDEWIPQSQITDDSEVWKEGDEGKLVVTEWFAEKKGWL